LTIAQPDGRLERKMTELRWPILALGDDKVRLVPIVRSDAHARKRTQGACWRTQRGTLARLCAACSPVRDSAAWCPLVFNSYSVCACAHAMHPTTQRARTHTRAHARTHTCTHEHMHACTHAHTHTFTHTHTHTHTRLCVYTCMRMCVCACVRA